MSYYPKEVIGSLEEMQNLTVQGHLAEDVDISTGDHTMAMSNGRYFQSSNAGKIKFDWSDKNGDTVTSVAGGFRVLAPNVSKVYQTGTDATDIQYWR
jgi:hypothetical protein